MSNNYALTVVAKTARVCGRMAELVPANKAQDAFKRPKHRPTADATVADYWPQKLLCNRAWVMHFRAVLDQFAAHGLPPRDESIAYVHIRLPSGGSEFRPMIRFDRLPETQAVYFDRGRETGAGNYVHVETL